MKNFKFPTCNGSSTDSRIDADSNVDIFTDELNLSWEKFNELLDKFDSKEEVDFTLLDKLSYLRSLEKSILNNRDIENELVEIMKDIDHEEQVNALLNDLNIDTEFEQQSDYDIKEPASDTSIENRINEARLQELHNIYTPKLLYLFREEEFEFGMTSQSEQLIKELLQVNSLATMNWINELFVKYYDNETILIGILRILGRIEPFSQCYTMAVTATRHKNVEIKELGIRAFESWVSADSLTLLKNLQIETPWLKDYVEGVIKDIEEQLCLT